LNSFDQFGLAEPITRALAQEQYVTPTPIQVQTIPLALSGRDVVGIAQTGTGKTAAFALPILHRLSANRPRPGRKGCSVLVLSPTRELSGQILDSFQTYGRHLHISATLAIGGVPMGRQVRALLNGVDVLVATPGRLIDLVRSNALRLGEVQYLVLDEADRMLDMGFIHDIRTIVAKLPAERQTLFFSATMPQAIGELAEQMLRNPAKVAVTPVASTVERVEQRIIRVDRPAKPAMLAEVLAREPIERALVFTRTKHGADKVVRGLEKAGIAAKAIHGNKSQNERERVLAAFRRGEVRTLVATDIAARGIDVDGISHVVNYDLPNVPESYVHRIGRTARAGAAGIAISFCDADEAPFLRAIEKLIRMAIPVTDRRSAPHAAYRPETQRPDGRHTPSRRNNGQHPRRNVGQDQRPREPRDELAAVAFMQHGRPRRSNRDGRPSRGRKQRIQDGKGRASGIRRPGDRDPPRRARPRGARQRPPDRRLHGGQDAPAPHQDARGRPGHRADFPLRPRQGPARVPPQGRAHGLERTPDPPATAVPPAVSR
jgi:superfamily II DNA/RNA helicase